MSRLIKANLTANDATAQEQLGKLYVDHATGKAYRYVLVEDAAIANGDSVEYSDTSGYEVTKDRSGGASVGRVPAGVAVGTISDGYYGWVQVSGRHTSIKTDGGVSAGQSLVPHATVDGRADSEANGSTVTVTSGQIFARALEADDGTTSAGTCAGMIINCL